MLSTLGVYYLMAFELSKIMRAEKLKNYQFKELRYIII